MEKVQFRCRGPCSCGWVCSVPRSLLGHRISCPYSGQVIPVPASPPGEDEWRKGADPQEMLSALPAGVSTRKQRLFAVACCRRVSSALSHELSRVALDLAERHADGSVGEDALAAQAQRLRDEYNSRRAAAGGNGNAVCGTDLDAAYQTLLRAWPESAAACARRTGQEATAQRNLLRCVFGNPFRPVALAPSVLTWNDRLVVRLAEATYDERQMPEGTLDNDRLLVLADALEEAGCSDEDILGHLRGPGPHVRGCWSVDSCIGKS